MNDLERKLELALKEIERLNQENHQLKQKLADISKNDSDPPGAGRPPVSNDAFMIKDPIANIEFDKGTVHNYSTPSEKIALFRSLFRGREDVYANRWAFLSRKSVSL